MEYNWFPNPFTEGWNLVVEEQFYPYVVGGASSSLTPFGVDYSRTLRGSSPRCLSRDRQRRRFEIEERMMYIWEEVPWNGPPHLYKEWLHKLRKDLKEEGGECYEEEDFETAVDYYTQCLEVCQVLHEEGFYGSAADREFVRKLYSNKAACRCKLGKYQSAIQDCDQALKIIRLAKLPPESRQKPLYWKARALKERGLYSEAWHTAEECRKIASSDSAIRALMEEIRPLLPPAIRRLLVQASPGQSESQRHTERGGQISDDINDDVHVPSSDAVSTDDREEEKEGVEKKTSKTAVKPKSKSKKQLKAEQKRREKEMEEIAREHEARKKEEALREEKRKQKASEREASKARAAVSEGYGEMTVGGGAEGRDDVVINGDTKTREDQKEEDGDDVEMASMDGSIDGEVQKASIAVAVSARTPASSPSPTYSASSSSPTHRASSSSPTYSASSPSPTHRASSSSPTHRASSSSPTYSASSPSPTHRASSPSPTHRASSSSPTHRASSSSPTHRASSPSPTHSPSSSSSPSLGKSSSTSPILTSSAPASKTTNSALRTESPGPPQAISTLESGKYEFLLACDGCFVQEDGLYGSGAYSYKLSTSHKCRGNVLLARNRNSKEPFVKIRPSPKHSFLFQGTYKLCHHFEESRPCKIGESRCTFAHNDIEKDLWTREGKEKFNREVVTSQLRTKDPNHWLQTKPSRETASNSSDTDTDSTATAESAEETSVGDLRRRVYDYKLVCDVCFPRDESKHGAGAHSYVQNKKHSCGENFLLARKKNTEDAFKKVRPRPQHAFFGTYKLCQQFQSSMPCMLGEPRCTFTHNEIEIDLWTRERQGKFNRDELMSQLSKTPVSEADAIRRLQQKHGGIFRFLCKECFQGSPTVISDSSLCDRHLRQGQSQEDIELLVHARETSKGETRFTPIMPLPQLTTNQIPLFCAYMDKCTFGGGRCGRAHGQVEMAVWMLERKYGTSQRQLVSGSSNTTGSRPMGNVPAQWRHVDCPFKLQFVCRECWVSPGLGRVVSKVSTDGETCERNKHAWNDSNRMCLSVDARKEIRKMPEKWISNFEMCRYIQPGKCCFLGQKCTYAHSEEERKVWTLLKEEKLRDLDVLVNLSQQQHTRPSSPATSSPRASPRTSDFPLLRPWISQYYCNLCHKTCNGRVTFDQHCSSEGHQARLRSDSSDNWQYRRPPWIGQDEEYKLCQRHAAGVCQYDGVEDRHNICPYAHSPEELDEWKERRQHRWLNMEMARKQNLFSYMDKLREEYEKTTDGLSIIADTLEGVSITPPHGQDESVLLETKGAKCTWTFTVASKEPLEHVALLSNEHRTHFCLHGTGLEDNCQVAEGKQFLNPSDNTYTVEVQGTSQMFGGFGPQSVIFDFGKRPVVERRLVLYVGVGPDNAQVSPDPPNVERWHSGNRSIVKFDDGLSPEDQALLAKYKEPMEEPGEVLARLSRRKKELDETVYKKRMHDLLYLEELTRNREIASIRTETALDLSDRIEDGILLFAEGGTLYTKLHLQDQLSEDGPAGKLILTNVNTVLLAPKGSDTNKVYEASIVQLKGFEGRRRDNIYLQLSRRCCEDLNLSSGTTVEFEVRFQLNRLHFCYMHFAVDNMAALHAIFPSRVDMSWMKVVESLPTRKVQDTQLNARQRTAVTRIISGIGNTNPPVVLYGPFGTGKTRTMASAALQILQQPGTNVLIATHSNSAADLYLKEYIHPYVTSGHPEATPLRVYFKERRLETVDDTVKQYCKLDKTNPDKTSFAMPQMEDIMNHRIVIVTLTTSMYLIRMDIPPGHFTHILLDEAAQAMECETILPLCLADSTTRIVLSGDHKQMSPKVHSTEACDLSFDKSLLERMVQRYIRFGRGPGEKAENPFLVMLKDNYRCCEEILRFLSESFYGGLKSVGQPRHPRWYPLTFFSAEGEDKTGDYSTSYFNMAEVLEISERVHQLVKDWPDEWGERNLGDIGVITPYHNQTQLIRKELRQKRLGGVTVEMVTNIQGKQFRAVFISTVRTRKTTCDPNNDKNSYGFLSDSKLLNTAMTRAQSLVAVVGDPHALCSRGACQRVWQNFISECEKNKSLFPQTLTMSQIYETSESKTLNPEAQPFTPKGSTTPGSQGASPPRSTQGSLRERPKKIDEPDEIIRQLILESLEDENEEEARRFKAQVFDPNKVAVVQSQRDPSQVYLQYTSGQRTSVRRPAAPRLVRPRMGADNADREYDSGEDEPYDPTQLEVQEESDNQCFYTNYSPDELENLLQTEPDRYRRCRLVVKGSYTAYGETIGTDEDDIEINSRKNRGLGWTNDEVVVEILENADPESEVFTTSSDTKRGRVVGVIRSAVSLHLRKFVCVADSNNPRLMVPINTDAPKLVTYYGKENNSRPNKVRMYSYMPDASIRFKKYEDIDPMNPYKKLFVVRFLKWTPRYVYPLGVVTDVITPDKTLDTSMEILNHRFNVPSKYRGKVEEDVNKRYFLDWQIPPKERNQRKDLSRTHTAVFTVDPPEAMDLDDAFSVEDNLDGSYTVGIHIADVSYFLPTGSDLDKEAKERSTTLYSHTGKPPVHMIPKRLSEGVCSLLPNRDRLALSLFVTFNSDGDIIDEPKMERCVVHSRAKLSYAQAEDIIAGWGSLSVPQEVQDSVRILHTIAAARRQKRLGAAHLYHQPDEDKDTAVKSHTMVEEMMILANTTVAQILLQAFPQTTPLRKQQPPKKEKLDNWRKHHAGLSGHSVELSKTLLNEENADTPSDDIPLLKDIWDEIRFAALRGDLDTIQQLVCTDENHPTLARALLQLRGIQDRAVFKCSANHEPEDNRHYSLNQSAYTYFSSPIRRYIDVVVHRLLVALITKQQPQYTSDEMTEICSHYNNMENNAKTYERETLVLKLAYDWMTKPEVMYPVIDTVNEQEIQLLMPSVRHTESRQRRVAFSLLKPTALPSPEDEGGSVEVRWKQRIYDTAPDKTQLPWPSDRKRPLQLDSEKYVIRIPGQYWQRLVQHVQAGNMGFIRDVVTYIEDVVGMQLTLGPKVFEEVSSEAREGLFADHFCTFQMTYKPGQVVKVQLTGDIRKGLLSPCIQLFNLTPKMDVCLDHRRDAVTRFAVPATRSVANILRYGSVQAYQARWLPIMAVEAAHCAVENNESVVVHGAYISWEKRQTPSGSVAYFGQITLSQKFCKDRCIYFNQNNQSNLTAVNETGRHLDYICVRYTGVRAAMTHDGSFNITADKTEEKSPLVCWVGHCLVIPGVQLSKRDDVTVPIKLHQHLMSFPDTLLHHGTTIPATIEIITKTLPDRRMENAVRWLSGSSDLVQQIVTGQHITAEDNRLASEVTIEPLPAFYPLNQVQEQAVKQAIRQPFTLIQGPPGTGKTVTGVHIAYYLAQMNKLIQSVSGEGMYPPQVLYCGPSNKAVDVVTGYMKKIKGDLKIVRMYSEMIEREEFPIPNEPVHPNKCRSEKESKITNEHDDVSLHHLIRKPSNPNAEAIREFETRFRDPNYTVTEKDIMDYKVKIMQAKIYELRQKHVILCTCTAAASPKMGMATNIEQCIVDECGMCTEPESFVPIVGAPVERNESATFHNPKQVILIGDHQQLRPIVLEKSSQQLGLDTSLFQRYAETATMLTTQYRMHEAICSFPSGEFYENKLRTHQSVTARPRHRTLDRLWPGGANRPTAFCHVVGREEVQTVATAEGNQMSRSNEMEADMAVKMAISLVREHAVQPENVILLSQYRAQCALLNKKLSAERTKLNDKRLERVGVNSVVASQGSEWDYVIFSTVRSLPSYQIEQNPSPSWLRKYLGFIMDRNQVNVAITRAKRGLCIIGNKNLLKAHSLWNKLITDYDKQKCLVNNRNFMARPPAQQNAWTGPQQYPWANGTS